MLAEFVFSVVRTWWIECLGIFVLEGFRDGHQGFLADTRETRLLETEDLHFEAIVFTEDLFRVLFRVERVHQHKWNLAVVFLVEMLKWFQAHVNIVVHHNFE